MLFQPIGPELVVKHARTVKEDGRRQLRDRCELAVDYLEGRMRSDVESELRHRFPSSQSGDAGQEIQPITIPLVQRYIEEAADAYNHDVRRYFTDEDGSESDATREQTTKLQQMLDEARYEEIMHRNEQLMLLLRSNCVMYEAKRGKLRAALRFACDVYPVVGSNPAFIEASDPDDYEAFIVELFWATEDIRKAQERTFAFISSAQTTFFSGRGPDDPSNILSTHANPYTWMQVVDDVLPDGMRQAKPRELPGMMLTFWHPKLPLGELIPDSDVDIVEANRELNVALSSLIDIIRFQGHSVIVEKLSNPSDPKAKQRMGVRFPVVVNIADEVSALQLASNYTEQMQVLKDFVRMNAVMKRMSPNDFAIDGAPLTSGFAKLVDSLPKLEARRERLRSLKFYEERVAAPRLVAVGTKLGLLDQSARKMRLRVQFSDAEFPETQDERAKRLETDIKYNLSTAAKTLAKKLRITDQEAQGIIEDNRSANQTDRPVPEPAPSALGVMGGAGFGSLIRRPARPGQNAPPQS